MPAPKGLARFFRILGLLEEEVHVLVSRLCARELEVGEGDGVPLGDPDVTNEVPCKSERGNLDVSSKRAGG